MIIAIFINAPVVPNLHSAVPTADAFPPSSNVMGSPNVLMHPMRSRLTVQGFCIVYRRKETASGFWALEFYRFDQTKDPLFSKKAMDSSSAHPGNVFTKMKSAVVILIVGIAPMNLLGFARRISVLPLDSVVIMERALDDICGAMEIGIVLMVLTKNWVCVKFKMEFKSDRQLVDWLLLRKHQCHPKVSI